MLAAAVVLTLFGALLPKVPVAGAQEEDPFPEIVFIEPRPNRTVLVEWIAAEGQGDYEISYRRAGQWRKIADASVGDGGDRIARVLNPDDWPAAAGVDYEIGVGLPGEAPTTFAPIRLLASWPRPTLTASGANSVTISWDPVASSDPFVHYEVFLGRPTDRLATCSAAQITSRATASITLSSLPSTCGNRPLEPGGGYSVGLRVITNESPVVANSIAVTGAYVAGSNPDPERYRTGVVAQRWEIVDAATGQATVWNSINVRRGDHNTGYANRRADINSIATKGFDSLRVVMTWARFEPGPRAYDESAFNALDQLLGWAHDAGLEVVLDPIHLAGGPDWGIPDWAWERTNDGDYDSNAVIDALEENVATYLAHVTNRYHRHPAIVAIDLVNEPREPVYDQLAANNVELMVMYHDMIDLVRDIDPDKPLMLQPYYGSALVTAAELGSVSRATIADPTPRAADFTNLIWSLHDYYAGREGGAGADGYDRDGYGLRGRAGDGTRFRTDSWDGTGCYPSGYAAWHCTNDTSRADILRPSMTNHVTRHLDVANAAGMALYIGEYGIPHPSSRDAGWSGGELYLSDQIAIYDELGVSRALWAWSTEIDRTYGAYTMATGRWHPWAAYAVGAAVAPETSWAGDVDCDDRLTLHDARALADYFNGERRDGSCPVGPGEISLWSSDANFNARVERNDVNALLACLIRRC